MQVLAKFAALALGAASGRGGPAVTLNGVSIDGIVNQRIENCTVVIDAQGDIHVEAKGYAVRLSPADPPRAGKGADPAPVNGAADKLSHRYFLATEQTEPDGTQYDIAVFINEKWIRELKSADQQVVAEISKYLRRGSNRVVLAATKRAEGRRGSSKDATFKVVLGEGTVGGDSVVIEKPLVEMKRTQAETDHYTQEYTLVAN